ncbi:hypothetical protein WGM54_14605 [Paenibacillus polymyxa]|uniref:hypothetical protein n=1 Tax=Paenibacillus polymyxa TaxID=1406 RepID=UPI00307E7A0B
MRILTNYEDLIGKTISFVHAAQFAEAITIATTDNEVIVMNREIDEDEGEGNIRVFTEFRALEYIKKEDNRYVRNSLAKHAGFDIAEYNKLKREESLKRQDEWNLEREKREREEFNRLSRKYNVYGYKYYKEGQWCPLNGNEKVYETHEMVKTLKINQLAYVVNHVGYKAHISFNSKNELVWTLPELDYESEFYIDLSDNELNNELLWIIK